MKIFSTIIVLFQTVFLLAQDTLLICIPDALEFSSLQTLNTKSIEFSPVYYEQGIVYVVAKENNRIFDPKTGQAYFDLVYADIAPDGSVSKPVVFSPNIRTQYHEGPCSFSRDGKEIFFTRSDVGAKVDQRSGARKDVQLKIYHGTKGAEDWENIAELPFSSNEYSIAHPALSADGNYLVFSSDMPGGFGGMDLYIAERADGQWHDPVNLGSHINSKSHEIFPAWHEGGYLFFSSDRPGGFGGLDEYVTAWTGSNGFRGLQHLSAPFNSSRDDLGLVVSPDGRSGYMASDRKPTEGRDDLYRWYAAESIFCSPVFYQPVLVERELLVTNEAGDNISSAYVWTIPMDPGGPSLHREKFNTELVPNPQEPGSFYLKWGVTDTLSIESANAVSGENGRAVISIDESATYALVVRHKDYLPYVNVMAAENMPSYVRLQKTPEKPLNCYNTLFTVYNAAGTKRLENAMIKLKSSCLPVSVELIANQDGNAAGCLPAGCAVVAEINHEGFAPHTFTFSPSEEDEHWTIYLKGSEGLTAPPAPITSGTVIVLDNIYYDFNKSAIRKSDAGELDALAKILKQYPDLTIELISHTDSRGTAEYNMELSEKRSEAAKNYLVLLGIQSARITTKAAGESKLRNHCTDNVPCSEAEHQFNRRTEVRITNPAEGMQIRYKASN